MSAQRAPGQTPLIPTPTPRALRSARRMPLSGIRLREFDCPIDEVPSRFPRELLPHFQLPIAWPAMLDLRGPEGCRYTRGVWLELVIMAETDGLLSWSKTLGRWCLTELGAEMMPWEH